MHNYNYTQQHIGPAKALELYDTKWWVGQPARDVATFQLFTAELCMPFGDFHAAIEEALGRPIQTIEFAFNFQGIAAELLGEKEAPTMQEVMNLIPEDKRIIVFA